MGDHRRWLQRILQDTRADRRWLPRDSAKRATVADGVRRRRWPGSALLGAAARSVHDGQVANAHLVLRALAPVNVGNRPDIPFLGAALGGVVLDAADGELVAR